MLNQKKIWYGILLALCVSMLGGCGKDKKNVSENAYSVVEEKYTTNYSCKDKVGKDLIGNKVTYRIEQKKEMTEGEKLEVIAGLAEKDEEGGGTEPNVTSGNVVEAEAQWKDLNGKEKTYLLRGGELESFVTEKDGKETYQDRDDVE